METSKINSNAPVAEITGALGGFVCRVDIASVPASVVHQAKLTLLDTLGCIAAGASTDEAKRMLSVEAAQGGRAEALVIGGSTRLPVAAACRVNAYQGDIFELNDLTGGHAGIAVAPLALALGEAVGASGRQLIEAIIAGIEVTSRIYAAYYADIKPFTETGMAPPGLPSTFGAAATAARLLGLDEAQSSEAIAIAGALASWCPAEVIFGDGGTIKPMLFGAMPGTIGVMAARYAEAGLSGPPRILESNIGFYATVARRFDPAAFAVDAPWHLAAPRRKVHACCGYIHSALDSVVAMRREGVDVAGAAEIRVAMPGYILPVISKPAAPATPNEARFNAEYMLTLAANGVDEIGPEHSIGMAAWISRPEIAGLMRRIRISADPRLSHYHHSVVEVVHPDGTIIARKNLAPRGAPANPLSDADVVEKFRRLAAPLLGAAGAQAVIAAMDGLGEAPDLSKLMTPLEGC